MNLGTLLIRADASVAIGTGHVMRCLALAQAWQDVGGLAVFAMAEGTEALQERLANESCEVVRISATPGSAKDAAQTTAAAVKRQCDWVVVDGYPFGGEYQRALKAPGCKILLVDDYGHAQHYFADFVLNQNICAREQLYANREPHTRLLMGTSYCLLRREFAAWRTWKREIPSVCGRLLVVMGGSDPENITVRVVEALQLAGLQHLDTTVVIGGSNPNFESVRKIAAHVGHVTVRREVSNMAELMAEADAAVSAAGATCWELCLLALPALLIDVAPNQSEQAKELDRQRCAICIGDRTITAAQIATQLERIVDSWQLRQSLSQRSRELVDGNGAQRVVSAFHGSSGVRPG